MFNYQLGISFNLILFFLILMLYLISLIFGVCKFIITKTIALQFFKSLRKPLVCLFLTCFFETGITMSTGAGLELVLYGHLALNSVFFCLSLLSAGITDVCYHAQLKESY